jgi:hypothetical protein
MKESDREQTNLSLQTISMAHHYQNLVIWLKSVELSIQVIKQLKIVEPQFGL